MAKKVQIKATSQEPKTGCFAVKYLIKTTKKDDVFLEHEFEMARRYQIAFVKEARKRLNKYRNDPEVKAVFALYKKDRETVSNKHKNELKKSVNKYGLSEYEFYNFVRDYGNMHGRVLPVSVARGVAKRVVASFGACLYRKGERINISKEILTLSDTNSGKTASIVYRDGCVKYHYSKKRNKVSGLYAKIHIEENDLYKKEALVKRIKPSSIKRVRDKNGIYRYYVIFVFEGTPPKKYKFDKHTGEVKEMPLIRKTGPVGIDIGPSTVAMVNSDGDIIFEELGGGVKKIHNKIRVLSRKMDRQRRANNPNNYNADGTVKKGAYVLEDGKKIKRKLTWNHSKGYFKTKHELADLHARRAASLKQSQEILANKAISMGDIFYIENNGVAAWAKRAKKTELSDKTGKFKRKKRFGKSIGLHAPSQLTTIMSRKLSYDSLEITKINTRAIKASRVNHITKEYCAKTLGERWAYLDDAETIKVQRDMYSAFILMNSMSTEATDFERCNRTFNQFKIAHDLKINHLRDLQLSEKKRYPVCMGIK